MEAAKWGQDLVRVQTAIVRFISFDDAEGTVVTIVDIP
jgi:hypothetical protein